MGVLHQPVLLHAALDGLALIPDGIYVDGTFGRGGHAQAILSRLNDQGRLVVIDKDADAIAYARTQFGHDSRVSVAHGSFANMREITHQLGFDGRVAGVLLDLGVSSPQLDNAERGFSFMQSGPLDMRMDCNQLLSARVFVNAASVQDMTRVFREYGEERFALRIARAIERQRETEGPIENTAVLADVIKQANPSWEKHKHPATRVFQAIRIHVNNELGDLKQGLEHSLLILRHGGRLVVISFHSLEDRVVKQFMREQEQGPFVPAGVPIKATERIQTFKRIGKAIKPDEQENSMNSRARSAVLRIGEKLA